MRACASDAIRCSTTKWRQYGQLGSYRCPNCGFRARRACLRRTGRRTRRQTAPLSPAASRWASARERPFSGTYMLYNALAVYAAADCCGVRFPRRRGSSRSFEPHNGRLQRYEIAGKHILLNLAKNPTGFNQNLRIVTADPAPKAVAFFINDKEADGHDVSWLWDVDFQKLASSVTSCRLRRGHPAQRHAGAPEIRRRRRATRRRRTISSRRRGGIARGATSSSSRTTRPFPM